MFQHNIPIIVIGHSPSLLLLRKLLLCPVRACFVLSKIQRLSFYSFCTHFYSPCLLQYQLCIKSPRIVSNVLYDNRCGSNTRVWCLLLYCVVGKVSPLEARYGTEEREWYSSIIYLNNQVGMWVWGGGSIINKGEFISRKKNTN